jgi:hypothetical protein
MNCPICGKKLNSKGGGFALASHMRTHEKTAVIATCATCGQQEPFHVPATWGDKRKQREADKHFKDEGWIDVVDSLKMLCPNCAAG